jgi:hypothetical protein
LAAEIDGHSPQLFDKFIPGDGDNLANAMGYFDRNDPYQCKRWLNAYTIRQGLTYWKMLASPLDPKVIGQQQAYDVKTFDYYAGQKELWHDPKLQSYAIAMQGDPQAPNTITAMTRNIWSAKREERQSYYENHGGRKDGDTWKYPNGDRPWAAHVGYHANLRSKGGQPDFQGQQFFYGPGSSAFSMGGFRRASPQVWKSKNTVKRKWNGVGREDLQPDSGGALVHSTRGHHFLDVHQDRQGAQGV